MPRYIDHKPRPDWDFKCMTCGEPVRDHLLFWKRWLRRLAGLSPSDP